MTCEMFCLKSKPALPWPVPVVGLPKVAAPVTVIAGPDNGVVRKLTKPRIIIGREGSDFDLKDPEISRHHCILEVRGDYVHLRDLDSTNGTFYEEERARAALLSNNSEFRIGTTTLRLTFELK